MKKYFFILLFITLFSYSQNSVSEKYPVFVNCENKSAKLLEDCFFSELQNFVFQNFKTPENVVKNGFVGTVNILFEVDANGNFKTQNIAAIYPELITESNRVFKMLPQIKPATYNGRPTYYRYIFKLKLPLLDPNAIVNANIISVENDKQIKNKVLNELDSLVYKKFENPIFKSNLNIPFSHNNYARFDAQINQMGSNNHAASKPYNYTEVSKYYNFEKNIETLKSSKSGWWNNKIFNENLVAIQGQGYWFTLNPIVDLQLGNSFSNNGNNSTYLNTRALQINGGLGEQLSFSTTIFESQANFANYFNQYAVSLRPAGGNPAIVPGIGIVKDFKTTQFDMPSAEANLTFTPSKFINLQLGYGRNFIGDGYRSLLFGDGASPYPFVKMNTTFWKIKYTNTYMWIKDVRPEVTVERTFATKYMANHFLSWNVTNKFNIGFFESVIWTNTNDRGFDMPFVNPIIFYRTVEFPRRQEPETQFWV